MMAAMSPTKIAFLVAFLAACSGDDAATQPDAAAPTTCGPTADTENDGQLYSCTTRGGHDGVCTQDKNGAVQCFTACSARSDCDVGSSSYVYQLADNSRVCFCIPDQAAPP